MTSDNSKPTNEREIKENTLVEKKSSNNSYFFLLAIVITITICMLYTNYQINTHKQIINNNIQNILNRQNSLQEKLTKQLTLTTDKLDANLLAVNKKLNKALKNRAYSTNDWLMLKAKYCLQLAVINNNWTNDLQTTYGLLDSADEILKNLPHDKIDEIRESIAKEKLLIRQARQLDTVKILAKLSAIQQTAQDLPTKNTLSSNTKNQDIEVSQPNTWQEHLQYSLQQLKSLIIIKNNDESFSPTLTLSYIKMLRENITLNLQQAELAVIQRNQDIYVISIKQAIKNIESTYKLSNPKTQFVVKQLENLQEENLTTPKLELGASLQLLEEIMD